MARIPPARCGRTDRGDSTAWDDCNDDVCPRQPSDTYAHTDHAYPHTDHADHAYPHTDHHTAHDHDDVAAEWQRVCLLYRLYYREQRRGLLARHVDDCVGRASGRTDDGDVLWDRVHRRFRHAHDGPKQRVHRPGSRQRW